MPLLRKIALKLFKYSRTIALLLAAVLFTVLGVRAFDSLRGDPLQPWHLHIPDELSTRELSRADWVRYLENEDAIMLKMHQEVTLKLKPEAQFPGNRYYAGSPVNPETFDTNWNRSYILEPDGEPVGAVVLLHGLTDSPYSLRHLAKHYQDSGFVAVSIRLPGHGTVPAGLTKTYWQSWSAATNLAVREALRYIEADQPLHVVGFSNGGTLAVKYALDAIDDDALRIPDRLVLISPMIGITEMARFAGIAGWPAVFPAFAKASWISILPEFIPFKYNSFPVNGARQSSILTRVLQPRITSSARQGKLDRMPPVLTFQSVLDFTTSTRAVIAGLYENLPENGSELVLFDLNRSAVIGPMMSTNASTILERILPPAPRAYQVSLVTNANPHTRDVVEVLTASGEIGERIRDLGLSFPQEVFSLSHVAVPFPIDDSLYGLFPEPINQYGVSLGALAPRGERGTLIVSLDSLVRMSSNPFFPYMLEKISNTFPER